MNQILILFAHPALDALEKSRVNRRLAASVESLEGVTFHDLYEAYPDFDRNMVVADPQPMEIRSRSNPTRVQPKSRSHT